MWHCGRMRNITGAPVEGDDYFVRPREEGRILRELEQGTNLRINAPRRVGKTSLVLRMCHEWQRRSRKAVFLNVEDASDELSLLEKLLTGLLSEGLQPDAITKCKLWMGNARKAMGLSKVGAGIDLEFADAGDGGTTTLARAMESIFEKIENESEHVLIAIDELPEVLLALSKAHDGLARVARLLHWLRALRQTYRHHIRWVFLGSIGLEAFVEERLLGKTINDLTPLAIEALSPEEADAFLVRLGDDNNLPLSSEVRGSIIVRVGWPLPHHLQMVFHALRDLDLKAVDAAALDRAFVNLMSPQHLTEFDTWRQRLDEQFSSLESAAAKVILNHLCQHPNGRSRAQILNAMMVKSPSADARVVEERLSRLLQLLQRDGYLLAEGRRYAFRSFLLRDYWLHRNVL